MSYENHNISGDLAVGRDVNIGGDTTVAGKSKFKGAVKIDGILDAKHIKGAHKGLFTSETELNEEFPAPHTGWNAIVLDAEDETKGLLYIAENGKWVVKSTAPQPFQFLVDSINAYVSKKELEAAEAELLKRLQGKSDSSSAAIDPFRFLGEFKNANGADLLDALDNLHSTNKVDGYEGVWRFSVAGKPSVLYNFAMDYTADKWVQGLITVYSPHSNPDYTFAINNKVNILYRVLENDVWSKWRNITQDNEEAINDIKIVFSAKEWEDGFYIDKDGKKVATTNPSAVTDFIDIRNVKSIEVTGRNVGGLVALLAFYNEGKTFISSIASTNKPLVVNEIPEGARYIRATGNNDGNDKLIGYSTIGKVIECIETLKSDIKEEILYLNEEIYNNDIFSTSYRYIDSSTGKSTGTTSLSSAVTDFIDIRNVKSIEVTGRNVGGLVALLAFYNEGKTFISSIASTNKPLVVNEIPEGARYIRATGNNDGNDKIVLHYSYSIKDELSFIKGEIIDVKEGLSTTEYLLYGANIFSTSYRYIDSSTGKSTGTTSLSSAVTDFIDIRNVKSIEVTGRNVGGLVALLAFYNEGKTFISSIASTNKPLVVSEIPEGARYIRATGNNDGNDKIVLQIYAGLQVDVEMLKNDVKSLENDVRLSFSSNILLTGASFAYDGNQWPAIMADNLKVKCYNKAVSGSSILDTARKMYAGNLYSAEEMEDFGVFLIMHVHNLDVFNISEGKELMENYTDYENTTFFPIEYTANKPANMSYAQAYDYVLKKYAAECYALKDNSASKWYGQPMGKPCKVACLTHWHDARTIYNESIRQLQKKWGFTLIELDKEIGFSKEQVHPSTGEQVSVLYAQDTETINSFVYGWHPSRTLVNDGYPVIQQRIANIVANRLLSIGGI